MNPFSKYLETRKSPMAAHLISSVVHEGTSRTLEAQTETEDAASNFPQHNDGSFPAFAHISEEQIWQWIDY
jgi:hypothetical protein